MPCSLQPSYERLLFSSRKRRCCWQHPESRSPVFLPWSSRLSCGRTWSASADPEPDVCQLLPRSEPDKSVSYTHLVEDVFSITGRGTVATGRVEAGVLHVSDEVEIVGIKEETRKVVVTGIEMFRKLLDEAQAGDNIGALLRGVQRNEIERGQVLAKPGTITCHTKFTAQVYVLTKDEGGRHTPFFNNYRPQFYFRTTDVTGVINLPEGTEMCMPGDNIEMTIELIHPIAMSQGLTFAIREGGRTVGSGRVATVIE